MSTAAATQGTRIAVARTFIAGSVVALLIAASVTYAIDDVELSIEAAQGPNWQAQGLLAEIDLTSNEIKGRVRIDTVRFAALPDAIQNVVVECPDLAMTQQAFACRGARVLADVPLIGKQTLHAHLRYERETGALELEVAGIRIGSGKVAMHASLREEKWNARVTLDEVPLDALLALGRAADVDLPIETATGSTSLEIRVGGRNAGIVDVQAKGSVQQLVSNNESGSFATDGLAARFEIALARAQEAWTYEANVVADNGQGYAEPFFLDFGVHALELTARGTLVGTDRLSAETFRVAHSGVLHAHGQAALDFTQEQPLRDLELQIAALEFPGAYETYLQPLLLDTDFKSLRMTGGLSGAISLVDGEPREIRMAVEAMDVEGDQPTIALKGVRGTFNWTLQGEPTPSELAWSAAGFYGIELGEAALRFATAGEDFELMEPTRIPLFDGALEVDALTVRGAGSEDVGFRVDATIQPISVSQLCKAFGWPEFGGRVSGAISNLQLEEGVLTLATTLRAQVFDGLVTVKDLRLEDPFGSWPRFSADIDLEALDLELLTSAFSFGRITGRLSGGIHGLQLFNWSPIAFDARLFTPETDRSRHRISQRAVENIGSIGGGGAGVTAALSKGVLRFFDDFNYARLGITCKLENEVCQMGGVGPAPNGGYYLVQGRGLPRIDVIGNSRRVDWPRLVQQLIAATESSGPVVD